MGVLEFGIDHSLVFSRIRPCRRGRPQEPPEILSRQTAISWLEHPGINDHEGLGDAESLGRLNIAAASAALADRSHILRVRDIVAEERNKWNTVLDGLRLTRTHSAADFVFFNTGHPQPEIAAVLHNRGIEIGTQFPPYDTWARISIGLPAENRIVQQQIREVLRSSA
jgi:hypothetical protein